MGLEQIPQSLRRKFHIDEREHATAILARDFPEQLADSLACLENFWLLKSHIIAKGKNRSDISKTVDDFLQAPPRSWREKRFDTRIVVDGVEIPSPTHKIDNFKNRVGVEMEWNNKDAPTAVGLRLATIRLHFAFSQHIKTALRTWQNASFSGLFH